MKVSGRPFTAMDSFFGVPASDGVLQVLLNARHESVFEAVLFRQRLIGTWIIGQDHGVLARIVLKIVKDAFSLHEPADKRKIRFAVLNAIVPGSVILGQRELIIFKPEITKYLLNDIGYGFLLKYPAVGRK